MTDASNAEGQLAGHYVLTKAEGAYLELRQRILEGTIVAGSAINQERLAASLGVSITPLREALRRLEAEELVTLSAHKIVTVVPLTWQELHDLCITRQQIDPLAAELAASEATDGEIQAIAALAAQPRTADLRHLLGAHRAFHFAIYTASHNKVLAGILSQLWDRTNRYRIMMLRDSNFDQTTGAEHLEIAEAIRHRRGTAAADLMRKHVDEALRSVEKTSKPYLVGIEPTDESKRGV